MSYSEPVKFSSTNNYGCGKENEDDVYTIEEFKNLVECGAFIDYDGFGYPVKHEYANSSIIIKPSQIEKIPHDATHIVWFNK